MAAFARDRVDEWLPPDNTYCQGVLRQWGMGPLEWSRNGQSYSCSMCGSMSVEELLECLDGPEIEFSINDHGNKVYVRRYRTPATARRSTTTPSASAMSVEVVGRSSSTSGTCATAAAPKRSSSASTRG